jgi:hypothetical protein
MPSSVLPAKRAHQEKRLLRKAAGKGVPQVVPVKALNARFADGGLKPMARRATAAKKPATDTRNQKSTRLG